MRTKNRFSVLQATESWAGPGNEATRLAHSFWTKTSLTHQFLFLPYQVCQHDLITHLLITEPSSTFYTIRGNVEETEVIQAVIVSNFTFHSLSTSDKEWISCSAEKSWITKVYTL